MSDVTERLRSEASAQPTNTVVVLGHEHEVPGRVAKLLAEAIAEIERLRSAGIPWQPITDESALPEFFIAWSPRFPDQCACFRRGIFIQMRRRDTPDHLSVGSYTHWAPVNPPEDHS